MVRLKLPIDFDAVDGQLVDLVCLLLLSNENAEVQLSALAGVARRLRIPEVLAQLRRAPNRVVLYQSGTCRQPGTVTDRKISFGGASFGLL
jgi:PTS system nitrogen regulatory IIA component